MSQDDEFQKVEIDMSRCSGPDGCVADWHALGADYGGHLGLQLAQLAWHCFRE